MFRLFECCALSFFERFVLSFSLKIERFVSDSAEIWICGLYLQELIEKHHIENSFSLCPPTKSIQEKYLESSIYVMSSRFEGLPMALLEAMACGVPCISFDCPYGPAEIITPEEDGILVKNGNTDELADAICRLIEDTDKRIRMGKQAQKNIQRYSREEVMKLWDELFNTLTTARP